jgi:hypothetical protein
MKQSVFTSRQTTQKLAFCAPTEVVRGLTHQKKARAEYRNSGSIEAESIKVRADTDLDEPVAADPGAGALGKGGGALGKGGGALGKGGGAPVTCCGGKDWDNGAAA